MENKKMIETIEKKLGVKVEKVYEVTQSGKEIIVDVKVGDNAYRKVVLKEMRNQYGPYYKIISESKYARKRAEAPVAEKPAKKSETKLRTKTEMLCGARRRDIIGFATQRIGSLADGTATLKEIEGPANGDTAIRFVLILNADGSRFKEDIAISEIRENVAV